MASRTRIGRGICTLLALSTLLAVHPAAQGATGADADVQVARADDVSLQANGQLRGQVLDQQGQPQAFTQVVFLQNNRPIGSTKTDLTGQFVMPGLPPGAYQVQTQIAAKSVRIWAARTAPPLARQAVLLVADGDVTRAKSEGKSSGQYGPAIRGAIVGGVITGLTFWAFDYNEAS